MTKNRLAVALLALSSFGLSGGMAWAQTTVKATGNADIIVSMTVTGVSEPYRDFAGSRENAQALVVGLRDGTPIELKSETGLLSALTPSVTFKPATAKLGLGNVDIALSLAKADLAKVGITNPTPTQLQVALNGGTFATTSGPVTLGGILAQRQSGMGWGQIAHRMDVKLGALVSGSKTDNLPSPKNASAMLNAHSPQSAHGKSGEAQSTHGNANASGNGHSSAGNSGGGNGSGGGNSGSGGGSKK